MCWFRQIYSPTVIVALFAVLILSPTPSDANLRLCGSRLTTTLLAVCRNQLCGGMRPFKRSRDSSWVPSTRDLFHMHPKQKRGGIATECCEKRCSFAYLKSFCCDNDDDDKF